MPASPYCQHTNFGRTKTTDAHHGHHGLVVLVHGIHGFSLFLVILETFALHARFWNRGDLMQSQHPGVWRNSDAYLTLLSALGEVWLRDFWVHLYPEGRPCGGYGHPPSRLFYDHLFPLP